MLPSLVLSLIIVAPGSPANDSCGVASAVLNLGEHQLPPSIVAHLTRYRDAWRRFCVGSKAPTLEDLFGDAVALEDELHGLPLATFVGGETPGDVGEAHRFADGGTAAIASIPGFRRGFVHSDLDIDLPEFARVAARTGRSRDATFFKGYTALREWAPGPPPNGDYDLLPWQGYAPGPYLEPCVRLGFDWARALTSLTTLGVHFEAGPYATAVQRLEERLADTLEAIARARTVTSCEDRLPLVPGLQQLREAARVQKRTRVYSAASELLILLQKGSIELVWSRTENR